MGDPPRTVPVDWDRFEFELWRWYGRTNDLRHLSKESTELWELLRRWKAGGR
jgi:hypothetical protein